MARPERLSGEPWKKASKSFQKTLVEAGKRITEFAVVALDGANGEFIRDLGSEAGDKGLVPYFTGNLLDSIGARILSGNVLRSYRTMETEGMRHATKPQHMRETKNIWGYIEVMKRITRPSRRQSKSVVSQLIVGVPYAQEVDWTHEYSPELRDKFYHKLDETLKVLEKTRFLVDV